MISIIVGIAIAVQYHSLVERYEGYGMLARIEGDRFGAMLESIAACHRALLRGNSFILNIGVEG